MSESSPVSSVIGEDASEEVAIVEDLPSSVTVLRSEETGCLCYIVGTAHVSQNSVDEVIQTIQKVKPEAVLIELCMGRVALLSDQTKQEKMSFKDIRKVLQNGKGSQVLYLLLAWTVQNATRDMDITIGTEMKTAYVEARKLEVPVYLGDRPVEITLKRAWRCLSLWEKIKLVSGLFGTLVLGLKVSEEEVEMMKNGDVLSELMEEMTKSFPGAAQTLVDERDQYLAARIRNCTERVVVSVVGMGHVKGIQNYWTKSIDMKELLTVAEPANTDGTCSWKRWMLSASAVAILCYGLSSFL